MEQHRGDTNVWPTDPGRLQEWKYWFRWNNKPPRPSLKVHPWISFLPKFWKELDNWNFPYLLFRGLPRKLMHADPHFHQVTEPDSIAYKTSLFLVCQLSVAALNPYPGFTTEHQRADVCPSSQKLQVWGLWVACCYSVAQSCPTLCDPMDCSTPGLRVLHHLPELAQTHAHWVGDAIPPSHPLSPPSPPAFNPSQHHHPVFI